MALVSIVIPVYNAEHFIKRCLDSILNQSFTDWKAILINDGSTDRSLEICKQYSQKDSRISIISQKNAGPSAARNVGIALAKSKYITFVDADDWVHIDYLKVLITPFIEDEKIDLVCSDYIEFSKYNPKGLKLHHLPSEWRRKKISNIEYAKFVFEGVNGVLWSKAFKMELINRYKLKLNEQVRLSEDLILVLEYLRYAKNIFSSDFHTYFYNRLNENNLTGILKMSNLEDLKLTNEIIEKLTPALNLDSKHIINNRISQTLKKLTYDIVLSKGGSLSAKEELKQISLMTQNFESLHIKGLKDKIHFFLLKKNLFKLDNLFISVYIFITDIKLNIKNK